MNTEQNVEGTEKFFNQWRIYQHVIAKNYMVHDNLIDIYHQFIRNNIQHPFSVLDLGCGDAHPASGIFKDTEILEYTGIDVSETALQSAQAKLKKLNCKQRFINDELSLAIQNYQHQFDVVMTGYSLHHLSTADKAIFFKHCRSALKPNGYYIMYDITALAGETRIQALERHWSVYSQWDFNDQEQALIKDHIFEQDFPETQESLRDLAIYQGFSGYKRLFTDDNKIFTAFCFY